MPLLRLELSYSLAAAKLQLDKARLFAWWLSYYVQHTFYKYNMTLMPYCSWNVLLLRQIVKSKFNIMEHLLRPLPQETAPIISYNPVMTNRISDPFPYTVTIT